jgi:hypothetical protein
VNKHLTRSHGVANSLLEEIEGALDVLREASYLRDNTMLVEGDTSSLLQQCLELCEDAERVNPEPVRTIHHFACTGGTLISKCLASMPNTQLLSELDPFSLMQLKEEKPILTPTDIIAQMRQSTAGVDEDLIVELFMNNLNVIVNSTIKKGQRLVLRDHSHSQYCTSRSLESRQSFYSLIKERYPVKSVVTVRDPLDSYLSLLNNGWVHFSPQTFDEYCRRYLVFLDDYKDIPIIRYEDFVTSPVKVMEEICDLLELPFVDDFEDLFSAIKLSGDSGRKAEFIAPRKRRQVSDALKQEVSGSARYACLREVYPRIHNSNLQTLKRSRPSESQDDEALTQQIERCLAATDFHEHADALLLSEAVSDNTKFQFCCLMSERLKARGDRLLALSFVNNAPLFISNQPEDAEAQYQLLSQLASNVQEANLSIQFLINAAEHSSGYDETEKNRLKTTYAALIAVSSKRQQHGQDLLLSHIKGNPPNADAAHKPLLIEIGTTRENVPGQGSTLQFVASCQEHGIEFKTVDMDPHNSRWATWSFKEATCFFEAITMKGEDYLRQLDRPIDYIFLDAYDFDHGNHSEQRQQRYHQFLGERIDEQQCHIMHLDCAQSVAKKLTADGVVCVDDTWLDNNNQWTAKGTLAVPYLLEHGFEIIEARNRAVLMKRVK